MSYCYWLEIGESHARIAREKKLGAVFVNGERTLPSVQSFFPQASSIQFRLPCEPVSIRPFILCPPPSNRPRSRLFPRYDRPPGDKLVAPPEIWTGHPFREHLLPYRLAKCKASKKKKTAAKTDKKTRLAPDDCRPSSSRKCQKDRVP